MAAQKYPIIAYYVAKSLNLAEIEKKNELSLLTKRRNSLVIQPSQDRTLVVFSFGVAVFFNFEEKLISKLLKQITKYGEETLEKPDTEDYAVVMDPEKKLSVEFDSVVVSKIDPEQIHLISEVLAQSAAIDHVEQRVNSFVKRFEHINASLEKSGRIPVHDKEVLKTIGAGRNIVQYVLSQLSLLDKPDITWEEKELESLFIGMRKMFELQDRFQALEFRLNFIQDTSELLLDVLENKRSFNLEVAVIVLSVADVALFLYEVLFK